MLRPLRSVECRDAVLDWDGTEPVRGGDGKGKGVPNAAEARRVGSGQPLTRRDGVTTKPRPVTGEAVPDEAARVPVVRYLNPRKAEWPEAAFVVGNPPHIGTKRMRQALGDGYVEALRAAHADVTDTVDLAMYWWHEAAERAGSGRARRPPRRWRGPSAAPRRSKWPTC